MKNVRKAAKTALSAAAIVIIGLPLTSMAAAPGNLDQDSVKVRYDDLNLRSTDDARELYSRLKRASRQACDYRHYNRMVSLREIAEARQCYLNSLDAAVKRIDRDALTDLHAG